MKIFFTLIVSLALLFSSCSDEHILSVEREDLFSLDIGRMEDQIDLYNLQGDRSIRKTRIFMRDGLFYISDGNGEKIARYTSYGDLLFMIYNDETNPPPMNLIKNPEPGSAVTRWAYAYPLNAPGEIAVDSRKHIFVEDRLPYERHGFDAENRALLDSLVLHFDADGRFVEYLGQEGIGGTPFPHIAGIYPSAGDEIVVLCRIPSGWNAYWFDREAALIYLIQIRDADLPIPPDREVFPSLDTIAVAPDSRRLFLKIDYYRDTYDQSTNTKSGSVMDNSIIWIMNAEDGSYIDTIEVPFYEKEFVENRRRVSEEVSYFMAGAADDGRVLMMAPDEGGYAILILSPDSQVRRQGFIRVSDEELQFNAFHYSSEGILSALLAGDWDARIVWWRTDQFMGETSSGSSFSGFFKGRL